MKTSFYIEIVIVISFIAITPSVPKEYPTENVQVQEAANILTERKIENIIDKVDYQFQKDSIHLTMLKNEQSKKH